ncbi:hypothetical protein SVIOM74S_08452 [Streptomyces violarus]
MWTISISWSVTDSPADHKDYLHRGGRTARAGGSGSVITLVTPDQRREMAVMADAGITPQTAQVHSADPELTRITGAQEPSGVPVIISAPQPQPQPQRARRPGAPRRSARSRRPGR